MVQYELVEFDVVENQTRTVDTDTDLQELIRRNFEKLMTGAYQVDTRTQEIGLPPNFERVDLKFWMLDFFLMECGLFSNDQRDQILDNYEDLGDDEE